MIILVEHFCKISQLIFANPWHLWAVLSEDLAQNCNTLWLCKPRQLEIRLNLEIWLNLAESGIQQLFWEDTFGLQLCTISSKDLCKCGETLTKICVNLTKLTWPSQALHSEGESPLKMSGKVGRSVSPSDSPNTDAYPFTSWAVDRPHLQCTCWRDISGPRSCSATMRHPPWLRDPAKSYWTHEWVPCLWCCSGTLRHTHRFFTCRRQAELRPSSSRLLSSAVWGSVWKFCYHVNNLTYSVSAISAQVPVSLCSRNYKMFLISVQPSVEPVACW